MKNSLVILLLIIYGCSNTPIKNYSFIDKRFWENLRLDTKSDNIDITFESTILESKTMKIEFINPTFKSITKKNYSKISDSLLTIIHINSQLDSNNSNYSISFLNGIHKKTKHYTLDEVNSTLGKYMFYKQDFDKAIFYFNKAIDCNPEKSVFYFYKAKSLYEIENYLESLALIKNYFKVKKGKSLLGLILLYKVYNKLNDDENKNSTIKEILKINPNYNVGELAADGNVSD